MVLHPLEILFSGNVGNSWYATYQLPISWNLMQFWGTIFGGDLRAVSTPMNVKFHDGKAPKTGTIRYWIIDIWHPVTMSFNGRCWFIFILPYFAHLFPFSVNGVPSGICFKASNSTIQLSPLQSKLPPLQQDPAIANTRHPRRPCQPLGLPPTAWC